MQIQVNWPSYTCSCRLSCITSTPPPVCSPSGSSAALAACSFSSEHLHSSTHQGAQRGLVQCRITFHRHVGLFRLRWDVKVRIVMLLLWFWFTPHVNEQSATCTTENYLLLLLFFSLLFSEDWLKCWAKLNSESHTAKLNLPAANTEHISVYF